MVDINIVIHNEIKSDIKALSEITKAAFETLPISNHTEQFIIDALRDADALTFSLVAVAGNKVVGHIAFSPVTISDGSAGWYGLGPISVLPELQKQGIGKSLIREGLYLLKSLGAKGCVLVGDPGYYESWASEVYRTWSLTAFHKRTFLHLPFEGSKTSGTVVFHEGFAANG